MCRLQKGSVSSVFYVKHVVLISTTSTRKSVSISRLSSDAWGKLNKGQDDTAVHQQATSALHYTPKSRELTVWNDSPREVTDCS